MLDRQSGAPRRGDGVYARRVTFERGSKARRGLLPLALGRAPEPQREKPLIDRNRRLAEQLRQAARCRTAVELHLPQPVARLKVADRPPCVLAGFGKNMRDAKPVEPHFDGTVQTSQGDPSV